MQTKTSKTHNSLSQEILTNIPNKNDFQEDFNDSEGEEDFSSEEDSNIVPDQLPVRKINRREEHIQAEKLKERNQGLQELQEKKQDLIFIENPENDCVSLKKLSKLSRPENKVKLACYIPEKNFLLVILDDDKTLNVYNTLNFNLIKIKEVERPVICMSYSKHLGMLIVSVHHASLQLWNTNTFEVQVESLTKGSRNFLSVGYVPKSHVIVAKSASQIFIYSTDLKTLRIFSLPICNNDSFLEWSSGVAEVREVAKDLLLVATHYARQNKLYLINLKTWTCKPLESIFIPPTSCVEITEKNPANVFTCLADFENQGLQSYLEEHPVKLTQFKIDIETEELGLCRKTTPSHVFQKLIRIENSKYLLAQRLDPYQNSETFILFVNNAQIEILRVVSQSSMRLDKYCNFIMTKRGSALIGISNEYMIYVYGLSVQKAKHSQIDSFVPSP